MNKNNQTTTLVLTALITALVLVCTLMLKIPVGPDCYIHLGDAVIFLAVIMLPRPNAIFAGSVGAALADLLGGYAFWAPATFVIKILMAMMCGFFIDSCKRKSESSSPNARAIHKLEIIGYIVSGAVGVIGYFIAEYILFGSWVPAATCIGPNCLQVYVGALVAVIISNALYRTNMSQIAYYHRPKVTK